MKRILLSLVMITMALGITAFQCSSTELTSARLYIQQKNNPKAKEALLREVEKNPKSDEGYYLLGYIYGEESDYTKMVESFDKSLEISKKFETKIKESRKFHWADNFNKGVSYFNRAQAVGTEDSIKMYFDRSIETFHNAILCEPDSADTYKNLTFAFLNANRSDEAEEPLKKIIKMKGTADSYVMLAQLYTDKGIKSMESFKTGKDKADSLESIAFYDKTITLLGEARKKYPDNGDLLLLLSNAYVSANKLDVAKDAFKTGVEKDPGNKYYRYNYGVLLLGANDFEDASEQFKAAVGLDSEYQNAVYNLAVTYVKWGSTIREKAEAEGKEDESYKEKFKLALPHLEKYVELKSDEPAVWELLGRVYANLGESEKSTKAFEKADSLR